MPCTRMLRNGNQLMYTTLKFASAASITAIMFLATADQVTLSSIEHVGKTSSDGASPAISNMLHPAGDQNTVSDYVQTAPPFGTLTASGTQTRTLSCTQLPFGLFVSGSHCMQSFPQTGLAGVSVSNFTAESPEPVMLALIGLGLAGFAGTRRRWPVWACRWIAAPPPPTHAGDSGPSRLHGGEQ